MADEAGKREGDEHEGLPEVEAELVSETAQSEDAFDEDAPEGAAQAAVEPDAQADEAARKKALTPGVMLFLGFVVVALTAFAVWRFTPHGVSVEAQLPPPAEAAPAKEPADETRTSSWTRDEPEPEPDEPAEEKIANAPADELKTPPEAAEGAAGYLPPVTAEREAKIGNSVEEGAKEAMRRFAEEDAAAEVAPEPQDLPEDQPADEAETAALEPEDAAETGPAPEPALVPAPDMATTETSDAEFADLRARYEEETQALRTELDNERRANEDLNSEIARLRSALAEAESDRDAAANEEVMALRDEVERLRRDRANTSSRQMRASFALAALARAVDQGDPFTEELEAVAEFEPSAAAALEAHAETGVATEAALRIGFDAAARAALAAAGQEKAGGGVPGLVARAKNLVSVRPAEPMAGDDPGAVLSRAEQALEEGEVSFALLELEDLPVSAQEAMAGWMAEARARAEAVAALGRLQAEISGETG